MQRNVADLISVLSKSMSEALPRRYGLWEPPQHQLAVEGIDHFIRFVVENEGVVWYAHPPVSGLHLYVPTERDLKRGFRPGTLNFSIDAEALTQPGWRHMVQTVWKQISAVVCPLYGHVWVSPGWQRRGGRYWSQPSSAPAADPSPEYGNLWGWWRGLPQSESLLGVVLGPPYLELWSAFAEQCERVGNLGFVSSDDWTYKSNALAKIGPSPAEMSEQLRRADGDADHPPVWPFALPVK